MKFKITIYENNSLGKEQITECKLFDNRSDAEKFIKETKATIKPYKIQDSGLYFTMSVN